MEQAPIIIDETIRDNILFGRKYDKEHYNRVIEACALTEDINAWKKGDKTVIGERGIKVSGGQRARLALARTIYSKADIYVLDDPLSAVDVHVKRHILDNVIMDSGLLGGTLRILAVSSEKLLPYFNQVIRLDEGKAVVTKQVPQTYQPLTTDFNHAKISVNDMSNTGLTNATEATESDQQTTVTEHPDDTGSDSEAEPDNSFGSKSGSKPDVREWSSNGQKQLFSLCRLLMRKRRIIVLDEATADVDLETDKEMQKLFRSEFKDSTVLTIAHRLETIMNSDKIIVMDKGRVVEFGPPKNLIDQGGYFSELVKANEF
ncbi:ATP-binding cassette glutathione S-conjugate transporter ycf1 [Coemansia sp. RSA 1285]|nr:ATP-binding cassette glutathione S-conjugate transporter ycf1 [Coemansia sp. RSA 1285]